MTAATFPRTRLELATMANGDALVRWPATEAAYWTLLETAEYKADFFQNHIIAMSYETDLHSQIVTRLLYFLSSFYLNRKDIRVHNPKRPICIHACNNAIFNPDASVVTQPPVYYEYRPGMNAETTPTIIVEVLSKNTRDYDLSEKLQCYKKIPSLRQIIYIDSTRLWVTIFERSNEDRQWLNTDFDHPTDQFFVEGQAISLQQIYQDIF
jgi:Uma2 family endonuclease